MSSFKKTSSSPPSDSKDDDDLEVGNADDDRTGQYYRISAGIKGKCDMCTEVLGYESMTENMDVFGGDEQTMESLTSSSSSSSPLRSSTSRMRMCGAVREKEKLREFPPLLSTLDQSGRPIFDFNKVRRNGGLEIEMVRNDKPSVVRTGDGRDGEVRMVVVKRDHQEKQQQEQKEDSEVSEEEDRERKYVVMIS